jgi:hypothetical protein
MLRTIVAVVSFAVAIPTAPAAVVVVANMTDKPVSFTVAGTAAPVELAAGESKALPCGRSLSITADGRAIPLEAWSVYAFAKIKGKATFQQVELAGKAVPVTDVPEAAKPIEPIVVRVKLLVDDANPFVRNNWAPRITKRLETAGSVLGTAIPIRFEIAGVDTWKSDPDATKADELALDFEDKVKPDAGVLAIGFSSRLPVLPSETAPTSLMKTRAPFRSHVLLREGLPRSESEQAEFLAHELGRWCGAVTSPDPDSVMRAKLGDGRAQLKSFPLRFDPLNLLALNLWASESRSGKVKTWQDLSPSTQSRLARVYDTLAKADPTEKQADAYAALIAAQAPADAIADAVRLGGGPSSTTPAKPGTTREQAIRRVLRGVAIRAIDLKAKPEKLSGDDLAVALIKTAADVALMEEEPFRVAAFATAIGIGLDDTTTLRSNPLTKSLCESVESAEEFRERTAAIATASLFGRRDLCQHFAVSCALADLVGPELARQAGLAKELQDMKGTSGFSFSDLAADYAGVELVERLRSDVHLLARVRQNFRTADYVPKPDGMPDGLTAKDFAAKFGSVADTRFRAKSAELRELVTKLGGYAK